MKRNLTLDETLLAHDETDAFASGSTSGPGGDPGAAHVLLCDPRNAYGRSDSVDREG
jgi:hypothetical protein